MSGTGRPAGKRDKDKEEDEELSYTIEDRSDWDGTGNKGIRKQLQEARRQAITKKTVDSSVIFNPWFDPKIVENLQTQITLLETFILKKKNKKSSEKYTSQIEQMKVNANQLAVINTLVIEKGPCQTNIGESKKEHTGPNFINALNDRDIRLLCENTKGQIELLQDVSKKTLQEAEGAKLLKDIISHCDTLLNMHYESKNKVQQEFIIKIQKEHEQARLALIEQQKREQEEQKQKQEKSKKSQEEKEISNKKRNFDPNREESKSSMTEKELALSQHKEHVDKSGLAEYYQTCLTTINTANKENGALISEAISTWANKAMQYQQGKAIKPSAMRAIGNMASKFPFLSTIVKDVGSAQSLEIRNRLTAILLHTQLLMEKDDPITTVKYLRQSLNNLKDTYSEVINLGRVYHQMLAITEAAEKKLGIKSEVRLHK